MIRAILVDDHEFFRYGVKSAMKSRHPDICVVGEAETGAELFKLLETMPTDILLLDVILPDISGIEITRRLKQEKPDLKILAISSETTIAVTKALLEAGVDGFISKRMSRTDELVEAIHSIMNGLEYFGKDISNIIYRIYVTKKKTTRITNEFTPQEKTIIELCRNGLTSKKIAAFLCISSRTVENHKNNIFHKLGINNTTEMISYALKKEIIGMED
jgi:DNA-binding NarL/FixJ family response regulator